jgi:P4 family phage/plasmid primase-like protien
MENRNYPKLTQEQQEKLEGYFEEIIPQLHKEGDYFKIGDIFGDEGGSCFGRWDDPFYIYETEEGGKTFTLLKLVQNVTKSNGKEFLNFLRKNGIKHPYREYKKEYSEEVGITEIEENSPTFKRFEERLRIGRIGDEDRDEFIKEMQKKLMCVNGFYAESKPIERGDPAEKYLYKRGISLSETQLEAYNGIIRVRKLPFDEDKNGNGYDLLAFSRNPKYEEGSREFEFLLALQIRINHKGEKYGFTADGVKKNYGILKGNHITLPGDGNDTLYICEGLEDGLIINNLTGSEVWVACSINNLCQPFTDETVGAQNNIVFVLDNDKDKTTGDFVPAEKIFKNLYYDAFLKRNLFYFRPDTKVKDINDDLKENGEESLTKRLKKKSGYVPLKARKREDLSYFNQIILDESKFQYSEQFEVSELGVVKRFFDLKLSEKIDGSSFKLIKGAVKSAPELYSFDDELGCWCYNDNKNQLYSIVKDIIDNLPNERNDYTDEEKKTINNLLKKNQTIVFACQIVTFILKYGLTLNFGQGLALFDTFLNDENKCNFTNGWVNLSDGSLHSHKEFNLFCKSIGIPYEKVDTKEFDDFVLDILQTEEDKKLFQQICGAALCGQGIMKAMTVLWGSGSNGKTKLQMAIADAFTNNHPLFGGDASYAAIVNGNAVFKKSDGNANSELAGLVGKRFAMITELDNEKLDEAVIKTATSDAKITTRQLHERSISMKPSFHYMVGTNYCPRLRSEGAIKDRLYLFECARKFVRKQENLIEGDNNVRLADPYLSWKGKEMMIIQWIIDGAVEWNKTKKLIKPRSMEDRVDTVLSTSDPIQVFIKQCYEYIPPQKEFIVDEYSMSRVKKPSYRMGIMRFYDDYSSFCQKIHEKPMNLFALQQHIWDTEERRGQYLIQEDREIFFCHHKKRLLGKRSSNKYGIEEFDNGDLVPGTTTEPVKTRKEIEIEIRKEIEVEVRKEIEKKIRKEIEEEMEAKMSKPLEIIKQEEIITTIEPLEIVKQEEIITILEPSEIIKQEEIIAEFNNSKWEKPKITEKEEIPIELPPGIPEEENSTAMEPSEIITKKSLNLKIANYSSLNVTTQKKEKERKEILPTIKKRRGRPPGTTNKKLE